MNTLRTLIADLSTAARRPVDLTARVDQGGNVALFAEWSSGSVRYSRMRAFRAEDIDAAPAGALESLLVHDVARFVERSG